MPAETHSQIASFVWGICNLLCAPYKRTERAFEIYVEEILLTRGGWKSGRHVAVERWQEYRAALIAAATTGRNQV